MQLASSLCLGLDFRIGFLDFGLLDKVTLYLLGCDV
jgi:hypothetical protein